MCCCSPLFNLVRLYAYEDFEIPQLYVSLSVSEKLSSVSARCRERAESKGRKPNLCIGALEAEENSVGTADEEY